MAVVSQCQADEICHFHVLSVFTNTWSFVSCGRAKSPGRVYNDWESKSDGSVLTFVNVLNPHPPRPETPFNDEPERVELDSFSESEDLASASLSYDCDSEDESGNDADTKDSDSERRGSHNPGVMNLKFQFDAVKAGECHGFGIMQLHN